MIAPPMKCNDAGLNIIKTHEGCRLESYWDPHADIYSIGYGHSGPDVTPGQVITQDEADALLPQDVSVAQNGINALVDVSLTSNQFSALCSLVYNIGVGSFEKSGTLAAINAKFYDQVPAHIKGWDKSGGVVLPGLVSRRADECALWSTPDAISA